MIRIRNEGKPAVFTDIKDAETGEPIKLVKRIEIVIDADSKGPPSARVEILKPDIDIVAEVKQEITVGKNSEVVRRLSEKSMEAEWGAVIGCFMLFLGEKAAWVYMERTPGGEPPQRLRAADISALRREFIDSIFKN